MKERMKEIKNEENKTKQRTKVIFGKSVKLGKKGRLISTREILLCRCLYRYDLS